MITLFAYAAIMCSQPVIVNKTSTWTEQDKKNLTYASKRCYTLYVEAPCLRTFTKTKTRTYRAICGRMEGSNEH